MMHPAAEAPLLQTTYDRDAARIGVVHVGVGAFHRAHQAVYFDDLMERTGDLGWAIAGVNLRPAQSGDIARLGSGGGTYVVKSYDPDGGSEFRQVRAHKAFFDWSRRAAQAEEIVAQGSVQVVSLTVTESGYCRADDGGLDLDNPEIRAEIDGSGRSSVYAYLRAALRNRRASGGRPLTILCCDNLRDNGTMLELQSPFLSFRGRRTGAGLVDRRSRIVPLFDGGPNHAPPGRTARDGSRRAFRDRRRFHDPLRTLQAVGDRRSFPRYTARSRLRRSRDRRRRPPLRGSQDQDPERGASCARLSCGAARFRDLRRRAPGPGPRRVSRRIDDEGDRALAGPSNAGRTRCVPQLGEETLPEPIHRRPHLPDRHGRSEQVSRVSPADNPCVLRARSRSPLVVDVGRELVRLLAPPRGGASRVRLRRSEASAGSSPARGRPRGGIRGFDGCSGGTRQDATPRSWARSAGELPSSRRNFPGADRMLEPGQGAGRSAVLEPESAGVSCSPAARPATTR